MARLIAHEDLAKTGVMQVMGIEFTYSDTTAFSLPALPAECVIDRMALYLETDFDSGTSDKLTVGVTGTVAGFSPNTETDLTTTAGYQTMAGAGSLGVPYKTTAATTILVTYTSTGTAPTQGKAQLYVHYYRVNV